MPRQVPQFTVIIPSYGRPLRLRRCLEALDTQDYPKSDYEVIVIDDGSLPPLRETVAGFAGTIQLRYIRQENTGPAAARNHGARLARFPYLAFTDDDCVPAESWLSILAQVVRQSPQSMVGGHTVNALTANTFATASQLLIDYLYGHYNREEKGARFFTSNNFVCPRATFWQIGGFDSQIPYAAGEDREFCDRWRLFGECMIYEPRARVFHYHRLNFFTFFRQHFNYGRGAFLFHVIRSQRRAERVRVESFAFYRRLLFFPLTQNGFPLSWFLTWLMGLTQFANAAGFFYQLTATRQNNKQQRRSLYIK
jgi:glycosyltransferase involved in cell wall biosynthesis